MPKEYKDVIHKEKKFTAKAAFINNKGLEREYENRCFESDAVRRQQELEREGIMTYDQDDLNDDDFEDDKLTA